MSRIRDFSNQTQLTFLTMLTSGLALLLACIACSSTNRLLSRKRWRRDFAILAGLCLPGFPPGLTLRPKVGRADPGYASAHPHKWAHVFFDTKANRARYERTDLKGRFAFQSLTARVRTLKNAASNTFKESYLAGEKMGQFIWRVTWRSCISASDNTV